MVVRRGQNDQSILPMAGHFRHRRLEEVVPAAEIVSLI